MKKYLIILLLAGLSLTRCATNMGPIDTNVIIRTAIETGAANNRDTIFTANWDAFYFYADTLAYHSPTLADVLAKQLRARNVAGNSAPSVIGAAGTAEVPDTAHIRFNHLKEKAILVVFQPDSMVYAWRPIELVDGLPDVYLDFYFQMWQKSRYEK